MDNRPRRSLSLKKSQKKLNFGTKVQGSDSGSTPSVPMQEAGPVSSSSSAWLSGLCNLGNTCYANSILQVLRFCPHFSSKVTTLSELLLKQHGSSLHGDGEECNGEAWQASKGALVIHLHKLWQRMEIKENAVAGNSSSLSATKPQKFISELREEHDVFNNKMQQDAQEMLRYLLTSLHDTLLGALRLLPPEEVQDRVVIDVETYVAHRLASRKRKFPQEAKDRCKVSKIMGKRSAFSTKVTDYFSTSNALTSDREDAAKSPAEKSQSPAEKSQSPANEQKPRLSTNEELDFVKEIFEGELVSQTRCYECDGSTRRAEPFLDVSLAVSSAGLPGFPVDATPHIHSSCSPCSVGPYSLSWVLSQFCLREKLQGDNKYRCERCGHLAEAERSVMFGHLPLVMTLHLNRFATHSVSRLSSTLAVNKVAGNVAVPLTLKFSSWCTEDCPRRDRVYHLVAVVFHEGSSCLTGHYTTCVRGRECRVVGSRHSPAVAEWIKADCSHWVDFDDEVVRLITQQELIDKLSPLTPSTAYMLFYAIT